MGGYPKGWSEKPIKFADVFSSDVLSESTNPDYRFRYVDIGSVSGIQGVKRYTEMSFSESPSRARKRVCTGDTIVSSVRTYLKAIALIDDSDDVIVSTGFSVLRPVDHEPEYLYYLCISELFCQQVNRYAWGIVYPAISENLTGRIKVPVPPRAEQAAIAKKLDAECAAIDAAIGTLEEQLSTLERYRASVIHEAVTRGLDPSVPTKPSGVEWIGVIPEGWRMSPLGYLGDFQNGISKDGGAFGAGFPFVSYGDAYRNRVLPEKVAGLVQSNGDERQRYSVQYGDVFFTRTSETIDEVGFAATCMQTIEDATFAGFLVRFRPRGGQLDCRFGSYYFRSEHLREFFAKEMVIVTRASLGQQLLKRVPVLLPPLDEQKEIADYLDTRTAAIDAVLDTKRKQLDILKRRRQSLIYEYVTGKRRVGEEA